MKRTLAMLVAAILPFVAMSASYTNSFVRDGVTYVQRGGLTIKDYVVTNVTSSSSGGGITTNDVCNIVTNEVIDSYVANLPYSPFWEVEQTSATFTITNFNWHGDMVRYVCNGKLYETNEFVYGQKMAEDNDVYLYVSDYPIPVGSTPDAWMLTFGTNGGFDGDDWNYFKAQTRNALGLARLTDLPLLTNDVLSMISSAAQSATNYTDSATNELARSFSVPDYANVSNAAMNALSRAEVEAGFTEWAFSSVPAWDGSFTISEDVPGDFVLTCLDQSGEIVGDDTVEATDPVELNFTVVLASGSLSVTATRTRLPKMADIPTDNAQLTNGAGYATTAAMTAALALKADASALPYALVTVTPTAGAPFVLAECFPIKYEDANTSIAHTVQLTDISHITVALNETSGKYEVFDSGFSEIYPICLLNADGTYYSRSDDADNLTFGANEDTPDSSTQVLGFTPTAQLIDRASAAVSLSAATMLTMPAVLVAGHARDLVVRLVVGADNLNITWGTVDADGVAVDYETEDGEFPDLSEAGTYLVRLTETAAFVAGTGGAADTPAKFLIQCQPLQTAAAGGGQ